MAYDSFNRHRESESDTIVSKKDKVQGLSFNQLKLEVHDTNEKDEKIATNFGAVNDEDVVIKSFADGKFSKKRLIFRF